MVKVQRKGQVTIPTRIRLQDGWADGDFVEVKAERGKIVLTPKLVVDREYSPAQRRAIDVRLAESLEQAKKGTMIGPFETHEEMEEFLHREAKKARPQKTKS